MISIAMLAALLHLGAADAPVNFTDYKVALEAWEICAANSVARLAVRTKEPAETVVDAAIGECSDEFYQIRLATLGLVGPDSSEKMLNGVMEIWRPRLIAGVIHIRDAPSKRK